MSKAVRTVDIEEGLFPQTDSPEALLQLGVGGSRVLKFFTAIVMRCWVILGTTVLLCLFTFWMYGSFLAFIILCVASAGILYHIEDNLLFYPEIPAHSRSFVPVPSMFGLPYDNVYIRSTDGTLLHLFFIRQPEELFGKVPTILYLHGNAGNIGHRLQNALGLYHNLKCNVVLLEYRGYGLSKGSPSEKGVYMDARAALNFLVSFNEINRAEIVVFGRSLGGAVAIDLATSPEYSEKIWCVILENTFTSIPDMAKVILGWRILHYFPLCFYKNKFMSVQKVMKLTLPTLFISGLADTLVPPRMMSQLHEACISTHKSLFQLETGTHNETWTCPGYYHSISTFMNDVRVRRRPVLPSDLPSKSNVKSL